MRTDLRGDDRGQPDPRSAWRTTGWWRLRWLELTVILAAAATAAVSLTKGWPYPLDLVLLLAALPPLAGIGTSAGIRVLSSAGAAEIAAVAIDAIVTGGITKTTGPHELPLAAAVAIIVTTVATLVGTKIKSRTEEVDPD